MSHNVSKQYRQTVQSYDPIWDKIRTEAEEITRREPALSSFIFANVLITAGWRKRSAIAWRNGSNMTM